MVEPVEPAWRVPVCGPGGFSLRSVESLNATPLAETAALRVALAALVARVSALEARPEEVAHFLTSAKLPTLAALATTTITLKGLVPTRAGDVLKAGECVSVEPATPLPAGVSIAAATVPADGTVTLQLLSTVLIAAGTAPITWTIVALR